MRAARRGLPSTLLVHLVVLGGARGIEAVLGRVGAFASKGWCGFLKFPTFFFWKRMDVGRMLLYHQTDGLRRISIYFCVFFIPKIIDLDVLRLF